MSKRLAIKLFDIVETEQGYAHISDGNEHMTNKQIIAIAEKSLRHHENCVRLLIGFLKQSRRIRKTRQVRA